MNRKILEKLRDATAFKPKPPDFELAIAHVHAADVGIPHAIDARVLNAMITDDEAFTIVIGPPGSGKSSLLAATGSDAARREGLPVALPLKVPVAHHTHSLTADLLVKGIAHTLAYELRGHLTATDRKKLEKALATRITTSRQSGGLSGSVSAGPPGLKAVIGAAIGKDLATLTSNADWQAGGPVQTLLTLRDLAAAYNTRLVVIFDDTDVWSVGDQEMATRAGSFFSALRFLLQCPEVSILVAVQTHWTETGTAAEAATRTARREYRVALRARWSPAARSTTTIQNASPQAHGSGDRPPSRNRSPKRDSPTGRIVGDALHGGGAGPARKPVLHEDHPPSYRRHPRRLRSPRRDARSDQSRTPA